MKIAIQGHLSRGHEVIQILESLGGKSRGDLTGRNYPHYYFINSNGDINLDLKINSLDYKLYTLEEFETQFPFKVGDIVQTAPYGEPAEVVKLYPNPACGIAYKVRYKSGVELQHAPENLKFYKEMKEKRTVTLSLEKAKEWYKKGGELREIALQAFTEKELTKVDLPKTWEELCKNYPMKKGESYVGACSEIHTMSVAEDSRDIEMDRNVCPSKKSAEAHLALIQLEQLRDCWRQGWEPTEHNTGYCIIRYPKEYSVLNYCFISFLSFPTQEMAEEFLKCFKDLIEQAGDLI